MLGIGLGFRSRVQDNVSGVKPIQKDQESPGVPDSHVRSSRGGSDHKQPPRFFQYHASVSG